MRAQVDLERGYEACREVVLGRANRNPRGDLRDGLVPDELVDEVGGVPELRHLEPGRMAEAVERLRYGLSGHPMERQRERVDRRRDEIRPRVHRGEGRSEPDACRSLHVEADRKPARLGEPGDERLRLVRYERAGRVVHQDAGRAEIGQLPGLLDEHVGLAGAARAVDETCVKRAAGTRDGRARLPKVRDVVERVVQPEDVDPVLRSARDEATDDVAADRTRADEEPTTERDPERRRHPCLDRTDPLPRALDTPADGCVEHAASRHLEARESRSVEDLRDPQDLGGRQLPGERLLREQADRRVDQLRHGWTLPRHRNERGQARLM